MARKLPQNIEAEQALLGTIIIYPDAMITSTESGLSGRDFFIDRNKVIYEALEKLYKDNKPTDFTSILALLNDLQLTDKIGGIDYLSSLSDAVVSGYSAQHYINLIKEKSTLRQMIATSEEVITMAFDSSFDVEKVMDNAERNFMNISQQRNTSDFRYIDEVLNKVLDTINQYKTTGGRPTGVKTGFKILDNVTHGLQSGDLIILAARPGVGKTALALNVAINASKNNDLKSVAIFSLEMSAESLLERMLSTESQVNSSILRAGTTSGEQHIALNEGSTRLRNLPIYMDDSPVISMSQIRSKCRKLKYDKGLSLVIVDYLQLVTAGSRRDNRYLEVSEISRDLKALARELQVPVIALSQLSRDVEKRQPLLSDLRESGSIEQDADMVIFLFRKDGKEEKNIGNDIENEVEMTVHIAKHRNGETRKFSLVFDKSIGKFLNVEYRPDDYTEEVQEVQVEEKN